MHLTQEGDIRKIDIADFNPYIAIESHHMDKVFKYLQSGRLKGSRVNMNKFTSTE